MTIQNFDASGRKHQDEINPKSVILLKKLLFQVRSETVEISAVNNNYRAFYPVEKDPAFSQLKDSLTETKFSKCLEQCKTAYQERCKFMVALALKLNSEAQAKTGVGNVSAINGNGLELSFGAVMICDTKWSLLEMLYDKIMPSIPPFWKRLTWVEPLRTPRSYAITQIRKDVWELKLGKIPLARGTKETMDNCESVHKEMVEDFKSSSDFVTYTAHNSKLEVFKKEFESILEKIIRHPSLITN